MMWILDSAEVFKYYSLWVFDIGWCLIYRNELEVVIQFYNDDNMYVQINKKSKKMSFR